MTTPEEIREKRRLVEQLRRSRMYRDYERAFRQCTGLPLSIRSDECFGLAHQGDPSENPFCALVAQSSRTCGECLVFQQKLTDAAAVEPATRMCAAGLHESAIPVRVGDQTIAYLRTGQMRLQAMPADGPERLERWFADLGITEGREAFAAAHEQSRHMPRRQYEAVLKLLTIFARQLAEYSKQLTSQEARTEQPAIARARAYIAEHHTGVLSLGDLARAVNMSPYHLCKSFHRSTGMTFTDYLARVRVEHVRQLLLDPDTRISDAAYAAGFQSLSQFSRVFRRITGLAPSEFRERQTLAKSA